jgi:hypothetical protein
MAPRGPRESRATAAPVRPDSWAKEAGAGRDEQGLFVIGAARSGTTVLQNALNHSRDIFLLGEPEFHFDMGDPGFAARYNALHRSWRNQETKSTFLPQLGPSDGPLDDHLARLRTLYRWVGSKIVVNAARHPSWTQRMFDYHCQNFYRARYIFTFRDPVAVICSTRDLQALTDSQADTVRALLANYAEVICLYARMLRNLPNVRAVFHGDMTEATFVDLGEWLKADLKGCHAYYDGARVRRYEINSLASDDVRHLDSVIELYCDLRAAVSAGFDRPQLEQNDANFDPKHYTKLGSIARHAELISAALRLPGTQDGPGESVLPIAAIQDKSEI